MPRNLILCCDGTNNEFGPENTNVVRLVQSLDRDPAKQLLYYDPGVGTLPGPGAFSKAQKWVSKVFGLAIGAGLSWKAGEAYTYLMETWEPGDRVFLFGFSRGAYTVRVLAGLLYGLGLLPRHNPNLVPYVIRLFESLRGTDPTQGSDYWKLCDEFRWTFARQVTATDDQRRFPVHFLGAWDTVSSIGWVWDPKSYPYTASNPGIAVVRHAVSVDERRCFFRQNLIKPVRGQASRELWFPGVHSDVGGGYPVADSSLWRPPFEWMLGEAESVGLLVDDKRLERVLIGTNNDDPWNDMKHESLTWKWWPAEFFPKMVWQPGRGKRPELGLGRHRRIETPIELHRSTLLRIKGNRNYAPPNLSAAFRQQVIDLADVPETMTYTPAPSAAVTAGASSSRSV
jgi:uncharacterized protein (DUF2235 family)